MSTTPDARTVLAIGAHPDDVEQLCAGTLVLLKQRGWRIAIAIMAPGVIDLPAGDRATAAETRLARARRSAALLDAEFHCVGDPGFSIFFSDVPCRRTTGVVRAVQPALVLTHSSLDHIGDHEETSRIVRTACVSAPNKTYKVANVPGGQTPTQSVPHLYYFDPLGGTDFLGNPTNAALIVNIASVFAEKERMLAVVDEADPQLAEAQQRMRKCAATRGKQGSFEFGEGFCQHHGESFPSDDLLAAALGDLAKPMPRAN